MLLLRTPCEDKKNTIRKRIRCRISVPRRTAGPPRSVRFREDGAPVDEGNAHLRPRDRGLNSPEPEHTTTVPVKRAPTQFV